MQEQKGKLSKTKIKEQIFNELKELGFHVTDVNVGNGYYLFDMGKNSVVHFRIKEIRKWLFGIWIIENKKDEVYNVSLFGDKINWIDKFKPTATPISTKMTLPFAWNNKTRGEYDDVGSIVWDIYSQLLKLKFNRHIGEYAIQEGHDSFASYVWNEFWEYDVCEPMKEFYDNYIAEKVYNVCTFFIGVRHCKYVRPRATYDRQKNHKSLCISPRFETGVEYREGLAEELKYQVYCNIKDGKLARFLQENTEFNIFLDNQDMRGVYYRSYYELKLKQEEAEREKRLEKLKQKANK